MADNTYNLATGNAGRAQWLAQISAEATQAVQTALATLQSAAVQGSLNSVPADLAHAIVLERRVPAWRRPCQPAVSD